MSAALQHQVAGAGRPKRDLAQDMLMGQHSVSYTATYCGLAPSQVDELARKLAQAKRIPKVRP